MCGNGTEVMDEEAAIVWDPDDGDALNQGVRWRDEFPMLLTTYDHNGADCVMVPLAECPKVVGDWTKVEDGLPERGVECWVYGVGLWESRGQRVLIAWENTGHGDWRNDEDGEIRDVTHWMKYVEPEPPCGQE